MKTKKSKATDIPMSVKKKVFERDKGRCVVCGNAYNVMPNAHIVPRTQNGLGIETNVVTMCTPLTTNRCHQKYDQGTQKEREEIDRIVVAYMKSIYGDSWCKEDQIYKKWSD